MRSSSPKTRFHFIPAEESTAAQATICETVEDEVRRWFCEEVVPEHLKQGERPRIDDLEDLAIKRYPSLSRRAFYLKVWTPGAPKQWLKGGRPKGPTRTHKARR